MKMEAVLDHSGSYRYLLRREWDTTKPKALWIMLNPSTANHQEDDPTVKSCIQFTSKWGYGSFEVVNLFAYRSKSPSDLKSLPKEVAIGFENYSYIQDAMDRADLIVAAWGSNGKIHKRNQDDELITLFEKYQLNCLDILKNGDPRHPLFFSTDKPFKNYKLTIGSFKNV